MTEFLKWLLVLTGVTSSLLATIVFIGVKSGRLKIINLEKLAQEKLISESPAVIWLNEFESSCQNALETTVQTEIKRLEYPESDFYSDTSIQVPNDRSHAQRFMRGLATTLNLDFPTIPLHA